MASRSLGILITGAGGGLGRGLALQCAVAGHRLFLADLRLDGLEQTIAEIPSAHRGAVSIHKLDVSSAGQVRAMIDSLAAERIDALINNAGLQHVSEIDAFPEERWDLLMDVMLKGPFLLTRALLPAMRARNFGRIINIGSIHSLVASPFKSAYVSAKHGLLGLAKAVALETAAHDITINTICPAYVRTPLVEAQIRSQAQANHISEKDVIDKIMLEPMPKKAFITVEEVAGTVEFLFSDAARNITGQTIVIDGGWTAR
jgi:3-hydroxybutyrate dehydrogenase